MSKKEVFIKSDLPMPQHYAVGPCPRCGRLDTWLNDVPLKAFCWGSEEKPHAEWSKTVPARFNIYSDKYDPSAEPAKIKFKDRRKIKS